LVRIQQLPRRLSHSFRAARCNPIAALDLGSFSCGKTNFGKVPRFLQRMPQKRKQKGRGRLLSVPSLDNKPRYETPDLVQLPTPAPTPQVKLPLRLHDSIPPLVRANVGARKMELEEVEEEESAQSSCEEGTSGPWVKKGNPIGFLDSEDEELIDGWAVEQEKERYRTMSRQEWKTVGLFLLKHFTRLVNGDGAPAGTDYENVLAILGEEGSEEFGGRETLCSWVNDIMAERDRYLSAEDDTQHRETALERDIAILKDQVKRLSAKGELELELTKVQKSLEDAVLMVNRQMEESQRLRKEMKQKVEEAEEAVELKWKAWAEKESQVKAGKAVAAERKKWQAKGKALPVEKVNQLSQTDCLEVEVKAEVVEMATQTEERKEERPIHTEELDVIMGEDSSASETEMKDNARVATPPATKKQVERRHSTKAGKKSQPGKHTPPVDNGSARAIVIHGVPCQRPMAEIIQDTGVRGIMGARWLLGGNRRVGKATSSVVVFFNRTLAIGSHLKMRGRWLPIVAYDFNRGKERVETGGTGGIFH